MKTDTKIRKLLIERTNKCARCGAQNNSFGLRSGSGKFSSISGSEYEHYKSRGYMIVRIRLELVNPEDLSLTSVVACGYCAKRIKEEIGAKGKPKQLKLF
jgi:DNA-directed RNA polymerase subunit RPC12/RpoP